MHEERRITHGLEHGAPPGRAPDARKAALVVMVACVVIAVGAAGGGLLLPPGSPEGVWRWLIRLAGVAAVGVGLHTLLGQRRRLRSAGARGDPMGIALRAGATIMVLLATVAYVFAPPDVPNRPRAAAGLPGVPRVQFGSSRGGGIGAVTPSRGGDSPIDANPTELPGISVESSLEEGAGPVIDVVLVRRGLIVLLVVLALMMLARKVKPREPLDIAFMLPAERAEEGLKDSLTELDRGGPFPDDRISSAYARLLDVLSRSGAPRRPHEAPHEHLFRTLGPLGIRPEPLHRLAALYVLANFGGRRVTEEHRRAAGEALEAALRDLRFRQEDPTSGRARRFERSPT